MSQADLDAYLARRRVENRNVLVADPTPREPEPESKLHDRIIKFCDSQWPRWKYIHARMDQRSTVAVGSQDFTIFLPQGRVVCIEAKAPGKKRTAEQLAWMVEMERLGHEVFLVESEQQFLEIVRNANR